MIATVSDLHTTPLQGAAPGAIDVEIVEAIQATFDAALPTFAAPEVASMWMEAIGTEISGEATDRVTVSYMVMPE